MEEDRDEEEHKSGSNSSSISLAVSTEECEESLEEVDNIGEVERKEGWGDSEVEELEMVEKDRDDGTQENGKDDGVLQLR